MPAAEPFFYCVSPPPTNGNPSVVQSCRLPR